MSLKEQFAIQDAASVSIKAAVIRAIAILMPYRDDLDFYICPDVVNLEEINLVDGMVAISYWDDNLEYGDNGFIKKCFRIPLELVENPTSAAIKTYIDKRRRRIAFSFKATND